MSCGGFRFTGENHHQEKDTSHLTTLYYMLLQPSYSSSLFPKNPLKSSLYFTLKQISFKNSNTHFLQCFWVGRGMFGLKGDVKFG